MSQNDSAISEQVRADEEYQRFFDDLYHLGRPADIFEPTVKSSPKPSYRKGRPQVRTRGVRLAQSARLSAVPDR